MNAIESFVDAIYKRFDAAGNHIEDDQRLPSRKVLKDICQVLINVSTMREEGRYPFFRVCFTRPDSELLDAYLYSHVRLFEEPMPFSEPVLHKLAPALNVNNSYLMLDIDGDEYQIIGILSAFTIWEKNVIRGNRNRLPRIPNLVVKNPGEVEACFGEEAIVSYKSGSCVFFRTDTFLSTLAAEQLKKGSTVSEENRIKLIYRILWRIRQYRHGALIFIVPSAEACKNYLDIKYKLPIRFLFEDEHKLEKSSEKRIEKDSITYAELIAKFTAVDGGVVFTKNFDLLGFGAEILVDNANRKHPKMRFVEYDNTVNRKKSFYDNGMRHRASYYLCDNVEDSVCIIISQDGIIKVCTKSEGEVVVYDNVAMPFF